MAANLVPSLEPSPFTTEMIAGRNARCDQSILDRRRIRQFIPGTSMRRSANAAFAENQLGLIHRRLTPIANLTSIPLL